MFDQKRGLFCYSLAAELPEQWDELAAENAFLTRSALALLEKFNPCGQKYYIDAGCRYSFVTYRLRLDLFTYARGLALRLPVTILGLPVSVSSPGFSYTGTGGQAAFEQCLRSWPHFLVLLNATARLKLPAAHTLSTYELAIHWDSFPAYLAALRSTYRRTALQTLAVFRTLECRWLQPQDFSETLYTLYLDVYKRSEAKLECLSIDFFRHAPARIAAFYAGGKPVAFLQLQNRQSRMQFVFGGFSAESAGLTLYPGLLLFMVEQAINEGCSLLQLGQTADDAKSRTGAVERILYMHIWHPFPPLRWLFTLLLPVFSWKPGLFRHRVFRSPA
ncbi:MAG: GNAT family N-acetyltransferase [Spirochaetes bacterium]|nr:GNAT family N-acetyltransferase [Spirochaetota bacterium]